MSVAPMPRGHGGGDAHPTLSLRDRLRGWGWPGAVAFAIVAAGVWITVPVGAALILIWARLSRTPLRAIGLVRPERWVPGLIAGIALGLAEKFLMKSIILPLLGAPAVNQAYHFLAGNPKRAIVFALLSIFQAGICEEIVFRGFLFERFGRLLGDGTAARVAIVVVTSLIFGAVHYSQGWAGVQNATIGGVMSGTIYLLSRRRLYLVMVSHATFDLAALVMIYWNLESTVAHLVFR